MSHLKSLTFTVIPEVTKDIRLIRRQRLIERLEDQKRLLSDPSYSPIQKRWKTLEDASRTLLETPKRIKPWWKMDPKGSVVFTVRAGLKALEFEKGKTGIVVGPLERLGSVIDTLIATTRSGELDALLGAVKGVEKRKVA